MNVTLCVDYNMLKLGCQYLSKLSYLFQLAVTQVSNIMTAHMTRARLRELGITLGNWPAGSSNAITDVPDVLVGHTTLIYDEPRVARTGVTVVLPRRGAIWNDNAPAAYHALNGTGEMTGVHWIAEAGVLGSPIAITNTHQCGLVRDALGIYAQEHGEKLHPDLFGTGLCDTPPARTVSRGR